MYFAQNCCNKVLLISEKEEVRSIAVLQMPSRQFIYAFGTSKELSLDVQV